MTDEKIINFRLTRMETVWIYRHLLAELAACEKDREQYTGELDSKRNAELTALQVQIDELKARTQQLKDRLVKGDTERLGLYDVGRNMREVLARDDTTEAEKEILQKRLSELPEQEFYVFDINYKFVKYILKLLERGLHHFKMKAIPEHLKTDESEFGKEDPLFTKDFVTRLKYREKNELEQLKLKFERAL